MDTWLTRILDGLATLRQRDPKGARIFGAGYHHYRLEPKLSPTVVEAFEARWRVRLPEAYRRFLLEIGNGGAGPFYGIFPLGTTDDGPLESFVGDLARPFPHRTQWNVPPEARDRLCRGEDDAVECGYWGLTDGAIPICHQGCALRDWLVVTGPEAGYVWHDGLSDYAGWTPWQARGGAHMTFEAWYLRWIEEALDDVPKHERLFPEPEVR